MDSLIWFIFTLLALVGAVRWIHRHMHGAAYLVTGSPDKALLLYSLPLLPGVLLHELSHILMAVVLRVRVGGLTLAPQRGPRGSVTLGSVRVERVDPIRASLIGLAPLLAGCGAVLLIGERVFGFSEIGSSIVAGQGLTLPDIFDRLAQAPDAWLWVYLIFAISNSMLPSPSDRETWPPVLLFIGAVFLLVGLSDQTELLQALADPLQSALAWLTAAFAITLIINLPVMLLVGLLERGAESVSGRRIYYSKPDEDGRRR